MNGKVQYTISYELFIPSLVGNWGSIFQRGASDADRVPGLWTYPSSSRIHFRHASTRSWNDGVDSVRSGPVNKWFKVKCVVDHNRAWIFVEGKFDGYVREDMSDPCLRNHRCRHCGVATHWTLLSDPPYDRMGVNARLLEPEALKDVSVREVDGRSWET